MFTQRTFNRVVLLALRLVVSLYGLLCLLFFGLISYDQTLLHNAAGYPRWALLPVVAMFGLALMIRRAATWALDHQLF